MYVLSRKDLKSLAQYDSVARRWERREFFQLPVYEFTWAPSSVLNILPTPKIGWKADSTFYIPFGVHTVRPLEGNIWGEEFWPGKEAFLFNLYATVEREERDVQLVSFRGHTLVSPTWFLIIIKAPPLGYGYYLTTDRDDATRLLPHFRSRIMEELVTLTEARVKGIVSTVRQELNRGIAVAEEVVTGIRERISALYKRGTDWVKKFLERGREAIDKRIQETGDFVEKISDRFRTGLSNRIKGLVSTVRKFGSKARRIIGRLTRRVSKTVKDTAARAKNTIANIAEGIDTKILDPIRKGFGMVKRILDWLQSFFQGLVEALKACIEFMLNEISKRLTIDQEKAKQLVEDFTAGFRNVVPFFIETLKKTERA